MQYFLENTRFKITPVSVRCLNEFGKSYTITYTILFDQNRAGPNKTSLYRTSGIPQPGPWLLSQEIMVITQLMGVTGIIIRTRYEAKLLQSPKKLEKHWTEAIFLNNNMFL